MVGIHTFVLIGKIDILSLNIVYLSTKGKMYIHLSVYLCKT